MSDKLQSAREQILQKIEAGLLPGGAKLPAAREFSEELGVSFTITQLAFNTLAREGILYSVPRQGTYVRHDWKERILPGSFHFYRPIWGEIARQYLIPEIPGLRTSDAFRDGIYETRHSFEAHWRQEDYLDLAPLFKEAWPDQGDFFSAPLQPFYSRTGKLYALPLIFSPWVIGCNVRMIEEAGGKVPSPNWTWEEFLELLRVLRSQYDADRVFRVNLLGFSIGLLLHAGGAILRKDGTYQVLLDHPDTVAAMKRLKELQRVIRRGNAPPPRTPYRTAFRNGELALSGCSRQDVDFDADFQWLSLPMPIIPGGNHQTRLAADLLCIRRQACDFDEAVKVIRLLFSPEVQDYLGQLRYGIPLRRSSAIRSFDENDPRDTVFLSEMPRIAPECASAWPEAYRLFQNGLERMWQDEITPEELCGELGPALRTLIRYQTGDQ